MQRRTLLFAASLNAFALALGSLTGCGGPADSGAKAVSEKSAAETPAQPTGTPLRLGVVDDKPLSAAVRELSAEWQARAGDPLEVVDLDPAQLDKLDVDAVVYPSHLLGLLVDRGLLVPLPNAWRDSPGLDWDDLFEFPRRREAAWGESLYAIPLGSPTLVVFYRADLLTAAGLQPPTNWTEYQKIAARFAEQSGGSLEPLAKGWAGITLLARVASYAKHPSNYSDLFDVESMRPLLDGPPFVTALEELVAAFKTGPAEQLNYTPADVRREFFAGKGALALTWPTPGPLPQPEALRLGVCEIPAGEKVFNVTNRSWQDRTHAAPTLLLSVSGRLGSVTTATHRGVAARELIGALSKGEWGAQLSRISPEVTMARRSQGAHPEPWMTPGGGAPAAAQYAQLLANRGRGNPWMFCLRIPGRSEYLAALDTAVHAACTGKSEPEAALIAAVDAWREITERLGQESQRQAYQRSLGIAP